MIPGVILGMVSKYALRQSQKEVLTPQESDYSVI